MLIYFLENNLYDDKFKEKLYQELPYIKKLHKSSIIFVLFADYNEIYYIDSDNDDGFFVRRLAEGNEVLRSLYIEFLKDVQDYKRACNYEIEYLFPISNGNFCVDNINDINSNLFWEQVEFYRKVYAENKRLFLKSVRQLTRFYKWLINKYNTLDFLYNSHNLTYELISNWNLTMYIIDGYYFTSIANKDDLGDLPKICFIIRGGDFHSTTTYKNSHILLDTSKIIEKRYRILINQYIQYLARLSLIQECKGINCVIEVLIFIESFKKQEDYPNENLFNFNTQEALLISKFIFKKSDLSKATYYNYFGKVRRFLRWCENNGHIEFSPTFFEHFTVYEYLPTNGGNPISPEQVELIIKQFIRLCKQEKKYKLYYAIFLILLETEYRISQVCNLKVSCIQTTLKNDKYIIYTNTKTTRGRKISQTIIVETKYVLDCVIEETENLRKRITIPSYKEHIFLEDNLRPINAKRFTNVLKEVCVLAGVNIYTSSNVRDTHMTQAYDFKLKKGLTDLQMSVLTGHVDSRTTMDHYVEIELTKMLESTHKILLEKRNGNEIEQIINVIPSKLKGNNHLVENGCGHCQADICSVSGSLPCLMYKDFIITIEHKPYFLKMIGILDRKLEVATVVHEIEDLTLMKKLYVGWLREIYIAEEKNGND